MKVGTRASGNFVARIEIRAHLIRDIFGHIRMGLNHTAAMLSPEGLKTFVCPTETCSQTFQLEARDKKSFVYSQYGRRASKAHRPNTVCLDCTGHFLDSECF